MKNLEKYTSTFTDGVVATLTEDVYQNAKKNIIPHTKTGRMENNLTQRVSKEKNKGWVFISDQGMITPFKGGTNYAVFVHYGTRPHYRKASSKKKTRWSGISNFFFAKRYKHPGYKGDPFMTNAAKKTMRNINSLIKGF